MNYVKAYPAYRIKKFFLLLFLFFIMVQLYCILIQRHESPTFTDSDVPCTATAVNTNCWVMPAHPQPLMLMLVECFLM